MINLVFSPRGVGGGGGGGGGALRYRGGPHPHYVFRGRRGLFLRPPHVRDFVKRRVLFSLGGHSDTEGGRTLATYFAEEGDLFEDLRMSAIL